MVGRDVPFNETEKCDVCGNIGAFDLMGDCICGDCIDLKRRDMEELRQCPFCGKSKFIMALTHSEIEEDCKFVGENGYACVCNASFGGCGAASGYQETKADAIKAWNTREGE